MVIQFILVNVQEVTEFGVFGENITPNIQEEKTAQWILVCTKSDYVPKKHHSSGTPKNINFWKIQYTFSPFQHRDGPWPVKSRQHRKAKSHSAQAAVDGILGSCSESMKAHPFREPIAPQAEPRGGSRPLLRR